MGKESACNTGDLGSIPGSGRSPGEGNDNPLQYVCLGNAMASIAWQAMVHGIRRDGHDIVTKPQLPVFCFLFLTSAITFGSDGKESTGDLDLIPGLGRGPGEEIGYPLQYSCPENPMNREAWQATVHGVAKSWT